MNKSLHKLCDDYGLVHFAKKPDLISHCAVQNIFNQFGDEGFFENLHRAVSRESLKEYNNYDILSLAILFYRYVKNTEDYDCVQKAAELGYTKKVYFAVSLPSYLYSLSAVFSASKELPLPRLTVDQYDFIRRGAVAGRIDYFNFKRTLTVGKVVSYDVTSMYPYIMFCAANVQFPGGARVEFKEMTIQKRDSILEILRNNENIYDKMGWYTIDLDQTYLSQNDLPIIICNKSEDGNNFKYDE
jgi:hypothetical protein